VTALSAHLVRQVAARLQASTWENNDLVFSTSAGRLINPNSLYRNYEAIIAAAGVPRIRLHDMRHTHATLLLQAGTPIKAVSERLGHAKTSITLDTYSLSCRTCKSAPFEISQDFARPLRLLDLQCHC
jgi:integrase